MCEIKQDRNFRILYETDKLVLGHLWETAFLVEKLTNKKLLKNDFYGDPRCGLISPNNDWAIVAGEYIVIWDSKKPLFKVETIEKPELAWIDSMRFKNQNIIELLVDPWAEYSAVWELNTETWKFVKIRDFPDYRDEPYTEEVIW